MDLTRVKSDHCPDNHTPPTVLLADLTRVKSGHCPDARACNPAQRLRAVRSGLTICHWQIVRAALTPWQARFRARPVRRGRISHPLRQRIAPCQRAWHALATARRTFHQKAR